MSEDDTFFRRAAHRSDHPAQAERRIVGALSALLFAGMLVGASASTRALATETIVSDSPSTPGAARVVLVGSTTTTTEPPPEPEP